MSCLICLEDTNNKIVTNCKCKFACHDTCFESFLKKSNFSCPICRIKRNTIYNNDNDLIHIIFKLPILIALPLWVVISILLTVFVFPFLAIREFYGNLHVTITYVIVTYFCRYISILYPMILIHFFVITTYFLDIRII
jgi:hypothetical protein